MLQGLVRYGGSGATAEDARAGCARALRCVPHGARLLWVHAYQSLLFNAACAARLRAPWPRDGAVAGDLVMPCLLYTSPSPRDRTRSRMPSSA